jgi:hypothetical protein
MLFKIFLPQSALDSILSVQNEARSSVVVEYGRREG